MKLINNVSLGGIALGAGAILLAPVVLPIVASVAKPLFKAVIKGGILAYEGARVSLAETKEVIEDITAEAKAEVVKEKEAV